MKKIRPALLTDSLIALVLTIMILLAGIISWTPIEEMEYRLYDFGSQLREKSPASPIAIIAIDDASITGIGR